jgi:translocator protein
MKKHTWLTLFVFILISQSAGFIGSLFTAGSINSWYSTLVKPALNPPGWVFGPVWFLLYTLMGVAAWYVWREGYKKKKVQKALAMFGVQLFLNALWSIIFFGMNKPGVALIEIVLLWGAIAWTIAVFSRISRLAGYLLVPYIAWVSFAMYLNYAIYALN